jgi:thymidylate synthase
VDYEVRHVTQAEAVMGHAKEEDLLDEIESLIKQIRNNQWNRDEESICCNPKTDRISLDIRTAAIMMIGAALTILTSL